MSEAKAHTVRAMRCHDLSGPEGLRLDRVEVAAPGAGEARLKMRACGVNFPDLLITRGQYQFKPELPFSPGMELAGEILDIGPGVEGFRPGDRVIARTMTLYPGFTEEVTLPVSLLTPIPEGMGDREAAAFFLTYYTAYNALVDRARLQPGEKLIVHGAAGGVGLAAVQIGLALGAEVIATAGSAAKIAHLRGEGAQHVVNYAEEDVRTRVKEITGGKGADVALDPVGGAAFDATVRALAPGGRLLVVGFTSGGVGTVPANIVLIKEISVIGIRAGEYARRNPEEMRAAMERMFEWVREGRLAPRIARAYPLEDAAKALMALEERSVIGKLVVTSD